MTLIYEWWYIPTVVTVVALVWGWWPRRGDLFSGLFEAYLSLFITAVAWAVAGILK